MQLSKYNLDRRLFFQGILTPWIWSSFLTNNSGICRIRNWWLRPFETCSWCSRTQLLASHRCCFWLFAKFAGHRCGDRMSLTKQIIYTRIRWIGTITIFRLYCCQGFWAKAFFSTKNAFIRSKRILLIFLSLEVIKWDTFYSRSYVERSFLQE